jgi:hypothetical protein
MHPLFNATSYYASLIRSINNYYYTFFDGGLEKIGYAPVPQTLSEHAADSERESYQTRHHDGTPERFMIISVLLIKIMIPSSRKNQSAIHDGDIGSFPRPAYPRQTDLDL